MVEATESFSETGGGFRDTRPHGLPNLHWRTVGMIHTGDCNTERNQHQQCVGAAWQRSKVRNEIVAMVRTKRKGLSVQLAHGNVGVISKGK